MNPHLVIRVERMQSYTKQNPEPLKLRMVKEMDQLNEMDVLVF
jgi:hypothetical protein